MISKPDAFFVVAAGTTTITTVGLPIATGTILTTGTTTTGSVVSRLPNTICPLKCRRFTDVRTVQKIIQDYSLRTQVPNIKKEVSEVSSCNENFADFKTIS